jgi:hypothetical protein
VGGVDDDETELSSVERFDPSTGVWSAVAAMNTARWCHGVTVVDGKLYAAGGKNDVDGTLSSAECFNPSTGQWGAVADMNTARAFVPIVALECPTE